MIEKQDLINFFPKYPDISDSKFNQEIYEKEELYKYKLKPIEERPPKGEPYNHQRIISRFLSGKNNYDELLLYHQMGSGKTCTSIAVSEILNGNHAIKKTMVITRGELLADNFQNELILKCTKEKYVPNNLEILDGNYFIDDNQVDEEDFFPVLRRRSRKLFSNNYSFNTYYKFASKVMDMTDEQIIQNYSNYLFILDEVHNIKFSEKPVIKDKDKKIVDVYKQFKRVFDLLPQRKILLLSGTPMVDQPEEISFLINLMLKNNNLPIGSKFNKQYLVKAKEEKEGDYYKVINKDKLGNFFKGRVSFLKSQLTDVEINYIGSSYGPLNFFNVFIDEMSEFQSKLYLQALNKDTEQSQDSGGIFFHSRRAAILVDKDNLMTELKSVTDIKQKLVILKKYSIKYHNIIDIMLTRPKENVFIYSWFVSDIGINLFVKILNEFNFSNFSGGGDINKMDKKQRYAVITSDVPNKYINNIQRQYNNPINKYGEYIRVVIGSEAVAEGLSFSNVQQIHVISPGWNYAKTEQAIFRGIRLNSHKDLVNPKVNIYQHVAILNDKKNKKLAFDTDYIDDLNDELIDEEDEDYGFSDDELDKVIEEGLEESDSDIEEKEEEIDTNLYSDDELDEVINNMLDTDDEEETIITEVGTPTDDDLDFIDDFDLESPSPQAGPSIPTPPQAGLSIPTPEPQTIPSDIPKIPDLEEPKEEVEPKEYIPKNPHKNINKAFKSIDLYMYYVSETKDFSIKQIERVIMEYAMDCQLFYDRNYNPNAINNSRNCQYQKCLYKCPNINEKKFKLDITSYQLYYKQDYINIVIKYLQNYFNNNFIINLDQLEKEININKFELLNVFSIIINNNMIFFNKYGIKSYLRHYNNYLFLVSNIRNQNVYMENYYNIVLLLNEFMDLVSYTDILELDENKNIFMKIINGDDLVRRQNIIKLKPSFQANLLEIAYKSPNDTEFKNWILNYYSPYLFRLNNGLVVNNILKIIYQGDFRCFNSDLMIWQDCEESDPPISEQVNSEIMKRYANPSNFYAIYNPTLDTAKTKTGIDIDGQVFYVDNFKLRDISGNVNLNQNTGIVCKTAKKKDIIPIVLSLNMLTERQLMNELNVNNNTDLIKEFTPKLMKEIEPYTKEQIKQMDRYSLLKLLYFGPMKKPKICTELYKWYKQNNLLVINII